MPVGLARLLERVLPKVGLEKTWIICSEHDAVLLAPIASKAKGILTYPTSVGPRMQSWLSLTGDHELMQKIIERLMAESHVPSPSIAWESLLPDTVERCTHRMEGWITNWKPGNYLLNDGVADRTQAIVKSGANLKVVSYNETEEPIK